MEITSPQKEGNLWNKKNIYMSFTRKNIDMSELWNAFTEYMSHKYFHVDSFINEVQLKFVVLIK